VSFVSTISVEADMKHRFSSDIIAAAVMVIMAVAVGSLSLTTGKPGDAGLRAAGKPPRWCSPSTIPAQMADVDSRRR
jgi:hypothetical protein